MPGLIVGPPVRGEDLYGRKELINFTWEKLERGSILLAAPRRFGKTSIMLHLRDYPQTGWRVFYLDTEWIRGASDFTAELMSDLLKVKRFRETIQKLRWVPRKLWKIVKGNIEEVELADFKVKLKGEIAEDWMEKGKALLKAIEKSEEKIVFIVDELPVMVKRMLRQDEKEARDFLYWLRGLRQLPNGLENIRFVVGGSIGIERLLDRMKAIDAINDLERIYVGPFVNDVARSFVADLFTSERIKADAAVNEKILKLIGPPVPYFVQVLVSEITKEMRNFKLPLTLELAERVYKDRVLGVECRTYFQHYYTRLRDYYEPQEERAAKAVLKELSKVGRLKQKALYQIYLEATGQAEDPDGFSYLMSDLENDFYINFVHTDNIYSFSSKILRDWWLRHYGLID